MSERGGHSGKVGDRYEALWMAKQLLRVVQGHLNFAQLEALGDDERGVDVWLEDADGRAIACQCKSGSSGSYSWPMETLARRGVLKYLAYQLGRDDKNRFRFISSLPAPGLDALSTRARDNKGDALEWLEEQVSKCPICRREFPSFCKALDLDPSRAGDLQVAFDLLRRTEVAMFRNDEETREDLAATANEYFEGSPVAALSHLRAMVVDRLRTRWYVEEILQQMRGAEIAPRPRLDDKRAAPAIERLQQTFASSIQQRLLGGSLIARTQARQILDLLGDGARIVAVHAPAGYGKSCVLLEVCTGLHAKGTPFLPLRLDRQTLLQDLEAYGRSQGLPSSPHLTLKRMAGQRRAVLIIDQLDALQWTGMNAASEMDAFERLCREALLHSNLSLVVACRTFDLRHDPMIENWTKAHKPAQVPIDRLPEPTARKLVEACGTAWEKLTTRQRSILREPQALRLWLDLKEPAFSTMADLMREFWDEQSRNWAAQSVEREAWDLIDILLDHMALHTQLWVPSDRSRKHKKASAKLQSLGVIADDGRQITFTHQSLADHLAARRVVDRMEDEGKRFMELAPSRRGQTLYFRHQLRHVLDLLRDRGGAVYEQTLRDIILGPNVRFHIRHMTLAWMGGIADPSEAEQRVISAACEVPALQENVTELTFRGSVPWTSLLLARGDLLRALQSGDTQRVNSSIWLMWNVRAECGDAIADVMSEGSLDDDLWRRYVRAVLPFQPETDTDSLFHYRLELARRCVASERYIWSTLAAASPRRCVQLLAAYADGFLGYAEGQFAQPIGVAELHRFSEHLAMARAGFGAADEVLRLLPQRFEQICGLDDRHDLKRLPGQPLAHTREAMLLMLTGASMSRAEDALDADVQGLASAYMPLYGVMLRHAPRELADGVLGWLLDDESRLSALSHGYVQHTWFGACRVIRRFAPSASRNAYERLEAKLLGFSDPSEIESARRHAQRRASDSLDSPNKVGLARYFLLQALPGRRTSDRAKAELSLLHQKFSHSHWVRYPRHRVRGGVVRSPLTGDKARALSDTAWIQIATSERTTGARWTDSPEGVVVSSGVEEFAADLGQVAQLYPDRFCALAQRLPPVATRYIGAVLSAVSWRRPPDGITAEHREAWKPASTEAIESLLGFVCGNWNDSYSYSFVDAIRNYPDCELSGSVIERLRALASHPDPQPGELKESETNGDDEARARDLEMQALNSIRGRTAEAVASLIRNRPDLAENLGSTVDTLLGDPHPAVRVAAIDIAAALTTQDAQLGIERFLQTIADTEEHVLLTRACRRMIGWSYARAKRRIGAVVAAMCRSEDPAVSRWGANHAASIHIVLGDLGDMCIACVTGAVAQRVGVAEAAARYFSDGKYVSACTPLLRVLLNDPDASVREATRACFRGQAWLEEAGAVAFAQESGHSNAVQEDPEGIIFSLSQCAGDLLPHAELIFAVCDAYQGRLAEQTRNIQHAEAAGPHWLGPVIFRLYEQATRQRDDVVIQGCLDAVDALLENRVGIGTELASVFDA